MIKLYVWKLSEIFFTYDFKKQKYQSENSQEMSWAADCFIGHITPEFVEEIGEV